MGHRHDVAAMRPGACDDDVLLHAQAVAIARTQSRRQDAQVAALPLNQARSFVRRLWEHAGSHDLAGTALPELIVKAALAHDVAALLSRLGVVCSATTTSEGQVRLTVSPPGDRYRFLREVALARAGEHFYGASPGETETGADRVRAAGLVASQ